MLDHTTRDTAALLLVAICAVALLAACDGARPPVLGVASSAIYVDAARMAIEDDAAEGGGQVVDTVLVGEGSNRAAPAIELAERLVATPGLIVVVGHSNSAASLAASQIYNAHEIVQIAPQSSAVIYSSAGPYSFRLVPPDDRQGTFLAGHLGEMLPDGGRIAVLYVNDDYGRGLRSNFLDALDPTRFQVVLQVPHVESGVTDEVIAHDVAAVADARPDGLVWLARGTILHLHLPALREALGNVPVLGGDATGTGRQGPNDDGRWDGVVFADFVDLDATPELRAFSRRYAESFGREATGADALTYDAVRLALAGVRAGARTGPEMRRFLMSLGRERDPVTGITGSISFDSVGDVDRPYVLTAVFPARTP